MSAHTGFAYRSGNTRIHRLDARIKLLTVATVGMVSLQAGLRGTALLLAAFALLGRLLHLSLRSVDREVRIFLVLLLLVFAARALFTPGQVLWQAGPLVVTLEGLREGLLVCSRLAVVIGFGWLFVAATPPGALKGAVHSLLRPVPGVPHQRLSTMVMLTVRLLPLVLDEARDTADAQRARGGGSRKNPLLRIVRLTVPVLRRSFLRADRLAEAMEARCYTEDRSPAVPPLTRADAAAAAWVAVFCVAVALIG